MRAPFICLASIFATPALAADLQFGLPIACEIGKTCWVQQYVDHDPSAAVQDYACGSQTYDGHDGTDIRIRDTAATADVIAAAAGTVKGLRDGVSDRLMKTEADREAVSKIECGNGVLIDHGNGWETQYCHLRKGSIAVKKGDNVAAGARLGAVGYSGMAAFPHVHITLRKNGKAIDPFAPEPASACGAGQSPLWSADAARALAYQPGDVIGAGFAPGAVEMAALEAGVAGLTLPEAGWPALVAYAWVINLQKGDVLTVSVTGPDGFAAENSVTLDRAKAQYLLFAGKKRPQAGWAKGFYEGQITVRKDGSTRLSRSFSHRLD